MRSCGTPTDPFDVLRLAEIDPPVADEVEVLVRVHAVRSGGARTDRSRSRAERRRPDFASPFLNDAGSCASYLFGCTTHAKLAVVDPRADLIDDYLAVATASGAPFVAVFETHVQADHVSGLPGLVERAGATAYLPERAGVEFEHVALADGDAVELGNTLVTAIATPGHAPAHHAYTVADRRRGDDEPWLAFSGDSLLIGDVGRPDLHVTEDAHGQARLLHASLRRPLELPDYVVLMPSHYGGSVCGRGLSGNPGLLDRLRARAQPAARARRQDAFAAALVADMPPRPAGQERIVATNRAGSMAMHV
jgi:glyoxylase-like metal-dependent hydrolase (beta-lactamase superfamily II)